ncbi:hypothetical protein K432DRAFT_256791, partial [Lepidopterella palustris CBS 459.81]
CRFYAKGFCRDGDSCRFKHDRTSTAASADEALETQNMQPICLFFAKGGCLKGTSCGYRHEKGTSNTLAPQGFARSPDIVPTAELLPTSSLINSIWSPTSQKYGLLDGGKMSSRNISGATVAFEDGAKISRISLPSDFSAVQMSGLSSDQTVENVLSLLAGLGFTNIEGSAVRLKHIPQTSTQAAEIKVEDPDFSRKLLECTGPQLKMNGNNVIITALQTDTSSGSSANRLQLSSVACTWYKPSKVAYLCYVNHKLAVDVAERIKWMGNKEVRQRKITVKYDFDNDSPKHYFHDRRILYRIQIGNLDVKTTQRELEALVGAPRPYKIEFGEPSTVMSAENAEASVKRRLEEIGTLSEWILSNDSSSSRVKAIAKFTHPEHARRAVQELNKITLDSAGSTKLLVAPILSVKMSVPSQILVAVKAELDELRDSAWKSSFVGTKIYNLDTAQSARKLHATLRIYGENRDAVAQAKSSIEKVLAGTIATFQDKPIRDRFFYEPQGSTFLESLMTKSNGFIYRDLRRGIIRLHGDARTVAKMQASLSEKVQELANQTHILELDAHFLKLALDGGFRRLVDAFGKEMVKMKITSGPKIITMQGSTKDFERAKAILQEATNQHLDVATALLKIEHVSEGSCPVCWMEPEEPFRASCGHTYCLSCLSAQCSFVSSDTLPLRCVGNSATCSHTFSLEELRNALPANEYDSLVEKSFTCYIRSNPAAFQYCPTPDCDRIYRVSMADNARTFLCDSCLTPVCTACHVIAHDGLSCDAYKALVKCDGAFDKWKKEHDVRDCPGCGTAIEKTYGCNHMECGGCGIHICWFCMRTFKTGGEVYDHMPKAHGHI